MRYLRICVFCCQTSYKSRNVFGDYQIIFFTGSSSFSCEKTTMKIPGPLNELFSKVVMTLTYQNVNVHKQKLSQLPLPSLWRFLIQTSLECCEEMISKSRLISAKITFESENRVLYSKNAVKHLK